MYVENTVKKEDADSLQNYFVGFLDYVCGDWTVHWFAGGEQMVRIESCTCTTAATYIKPIYIHAYTNLISIVKY